MSGARCAVGLLTWNGERDAPACVRSLLDQSEPELEIHWIDNGSTDATVERVCEAFPEFRLAEALDRNAGFCAGHNRGLAATRARYYLALNQDVILAPDYVALLCDWMDEHERLAMASGLILEMDASGTVDPSAPIASAGMAMGWGRFPFELAMGRAVTERDRARRRTPGVTGAAMLLRREAAEAIAPRPGEVFAPEFFAYFEEVDLALRLARAGWECGVEGGALAWHGSRGREGRASPELRMHYLKNHWLTTLRNTPLLRIAAEAPFILKSELLRYLPRYAKTPGAAMRAAWAAARGLPAARRFYRESAAKFPGGERGRREYHRLSRRLLRARD